jgi:hypothetical protein
MAKFIPIDKTFTFWQNKIKYWIKLKTIFSTKLFNKTFGYLIELAILLT